MSERHGLALRLERVRSLPAKGPFVLMGTMRNPLVAAYAGRHGLTSIAPEGYALEVNAGAAVVAGSDTPAPFTGSRRCGNWSARAASRALASAIGR